jgi:hypothetical protein
MNIKVIQVLPKEEYKIYVYFTDGRIKLFDVSSLVGKGVFKKLGDSDFFFNRCTVLNGTLAWDVSGSFDPEQCLDIDPYTIYNEGVEVSDPLQEIA